MGRCRAADVLNRSQRTTFIEQLVADDVAHQPARRVDEHGQQQGIALPFQSRSRRQAAIAVGDLAPVGLDIERALDRLCLDDECALKPKRRFAMSDPDDAALDRGHVALK